MTAIPLATQTIYAELLQQLRLSRNDPSPGSLTRRRVGDAVHLYSTERHGASRRQKYVGPLNAPETEEAARAIRTASKGAKTRRGLVAMLRGAGVAAPPAAVCRVLDALSRERMFEPNKLVLVGTLAYGTYPLVLGQDLRAAAMATNDIDLSVMPLVVTSQVEQASAPAILSRGDPALEPDRTSEPPSRFRSPTGLIVEFLTVSRRGGATMHAIPSLGISAQALPFMDYLIENSIEAALPWQDGVLLRVPEPARYAVHKLIVAQRRPMGDAKRNKDLLQASDLFAALQDTDPFRLNDALDDARNRGKTWASAVDAGLALLRA